MRLVADQVDVAVFVFFIVAVDESQGVDTPEIPTFVLVFQRKVETVCIAGLHHEVFFEEIAYRGVFLGVLIDLVSVEVGQLGELFPIALDVHSQVVGEINLGAEHVMVGFLELGGDLVSVIITWEVGYARQEAIEEVDHVAVAGGGYEVL